MEVKEKKKYLVVFDLNKTLVDRLKGFEKERKAVINSFDAPGPSLTAAKFKVWLRPHVTKLFQSVPASIGVAIWTSATRKTCEPIIKRILGDDSETTDRCEFVWYREKCDNVDYYNKKNECKDLVKIWKEFDHFTEMNTILVDDTASKARKQPENYLRIPEFDVSNPEWVNDESLEKMLEVLENLDTDRPADVRQYLKQENFIL